MTPDLVKMYIAGHLFNPLDFFLYISVAAVLATWVFLIAGLVTDKKIDEYPLGISKKTASMMIMLSGVFMALMVALKFLFLE